MHRRHHRRTLAAIMLAFVLFAFATLAYAAEDKTVTLLGGAPDTVKLTEPEAQFLALANAARKANNLPELTLAPVLVTAAREKSKEMCDLKYWGHESPVKEKRTAMRRVLFHLPKPPVTMTVGENLCFMSKLAVEDGHTALMNSPPTGAISSIPPTAMLASAVTRLRTAAPGSPSFSSISNTDRSADTNPPRRCQTGQHAFPEGRRWYRLTRNIRPPRRHAPRWGSASCAPPGR